MSHPARHRGLVFDWPRPHELHLMLPGMILVALGLHFVALMLFQLVYPQPNGMEPPAGRVMIPTNRTPGWAAASVWVDAADPSIFAPMRPEELLAPLTSPRPFVPSFMQRALKPMLPGEVDFAPPLPGAMGLPLAFGASADISNAASPPESNGTLVARLVVNGESLAVLPLERQADALAGAFPTGPAFLLARLDDDGVLRSVFLQSSSGSVVWDKLAVELLKTRGAGVLRGDSPWAWVSLELQSLPESMVPEKNIPPLDP